MPMGCQGGETEFMLRGCRYKKLLNFYELEMPLCFLQIPKFETSHCRLNMGILTQNKHIGQAFKL